MQLLGRALTLQQASRETIEWIESHAQRLDRLKAHYLDELTKYEVKPQPNAVMKKQGAQIRGGTSLAGLVHQIAEILGRIGAHRPQYAEKEIAKLQGMGYPLEVAAHEPCQ